MARSGRNSRGDRDRALRVVGLGLILHVLRSRRSYERAALAAIVLGALARMGKENQAKSLERLAAWVKRQDERVERKVKEAL
jgi:hypothetical protein